VISGRTPILRRDTSRRTRCTWWRCRLKSAQLCRCSSHPPQWRHAGRRPSSGPPSHLQCAPTGCRP